MREPHLSNTKRKFQVLPGLHGVVEVAAQRRPGEQEPVGPIFEPVCLCLVRLPGLLVCCPVSSLRELCFSLISYFEFRFPFFELRGKAFTFE